MKRLAFFFIIGSGFLSSCRETSFVPSHQHVPLFTGKKQWRIEQAVSYKSFDASIAYAPVNHLGTMLSVQGMLNTFSVEPAIGGFAYMNPLVLEMYAGYAYVSKDYHSLDYVDTRTSMLADRFFLQPSVGFHFNEFFELSLSAKISYWNFSRYEYTYQEYYTGGQQAMLFGVEQLTVDPVLTVKLGDGSLKGLMQAGIYHNVYEGKNSPDLYLDHFSPFFFKIGCSIPLNQYKKEGAGSAHDNVRRF